MIALRLARFASLAVVLSAAACDNHAGAGREPDEYTGCASDEQWRLFDDEDKHAVADAAQAPALTAPTSTALAAGGPPPVFSWSRAGAGDPGMSLGDVPHENGPGCDNCCPQWNGGALGPLHLPPISGTIYDLKFSVDGKVVWRVLSTLQQYKPTAAAWRAITAGSSVELSIVRLAVLRNDPREGPFVAPAPARFSVSR
jgi:hypothetical protein